MKSVHYDKATGVTTYEHQGVTFRCTPEAIADALQHQGLNIIAHVEQAIDTMIRFGTCDPNFSVCVKIRMDLPDDVNEIVHHIRVIKIPRLSIPSAELPSAASD